MTTRSCQNCKKALGPLDESYLYYSQVVCKACMIKLENQFQAPGSTNDNIETETPIAEEQSEQDKDVKYQSPAADDKVTADPEKDAENIKNRASSGQVDNNLAQKAAEDSSEGDSEKCEINLEKEAVNEPSSKQESPIDISAYVERAVRKQTGYIGRHWRGELPLAVSFWINVILIDLFLKSVEVLSAAFIHNPSRSTHVTIIHNPFVIMILYPWQIMGLWRSCDRHIETTGKWFWARTAQVLVVLGFIATLSDLVSSWPLYNL
jgi:hypothetical protein